MSFFKILHTYCSLLFYMAYFTTASIPLVNTKCDLNNSCQLNNSYEASLNITILILQFKKNYPVEKWKSYGLFSDDYISRINIHWLKFPPPDKSTHYLLAALYGVIMVLGLLGNALVIFMFARRKSLRTPANTLVVNLAISDFLMMSMLPIFIFNSINRGPALGDGVCRYYGFLGGLSGTVSICTLSAISLDRYYVVKYPLNLHFTNLRSKISLSLTWIYGGFFATIPLLNLDLGTYVPEGYLTSCSYDYLTDNQKAKVFILVFFVAAWVVPFILITYCYYTILRIAILKRDLKRGNSRFRDSSIHMKEEEKRKQEIKLAFVVFCVIGLWFAAWTPYAVVSLLGIADRADLITPMGSMVPALFAKIASCVDPFIYAVTHPRFKAEIRILFCGYSKSKRAITRKVWATSHSRSSWKFRQNSGESVEYDDDDDDDVEVEIVTLDSIDPRCAEGNNVRDVKNAMALKVISDSEMTMKRNTPWWYRPNFSNRYSSIQRLTITRSVSLTVKKQMSEG